MLITKILPISLDTKLSYLVVDNCQYLLLYKDNTTFYILVPFSIKVVLCSTKLSLTYSSKNNLLFYNFVQKYNSFQQDLNKLFVKKLVLKGLGLKVSLLNKHTLEFKLGYSHLIKVILPININITIMKNILILESSNAVLLGNEAFKIKKLRFPNMYKGKGICYKNEKLVLKILKKA